MALFTKIRERVSGINGNSKFDSLEQIAKREDNKEIADSLDKENTRAHHSNISVFTKEPIWKPLVRTSSFESSKKDDKFINIVPQNENFPNQNIAPSNLNSVNTPRNASFNVLASRSTASSTDKETITANKDNRFISSRVVASVTLPANESAKTASTSDSGKSQMGLQDDIFETSPDTVDESFEDEDDYLEQIFSKTRHNHGPQVLDAIQKGFDVNVIDSNGNSLLHICAQNNHRKLAASLLQNYPHCRVNGENFKGLTPLDYSEKYGFLKMTAWLSSVGAANGTSSKPVATMLR